MLVDFASVRCGGREPFPLRHARPGGKLTYPVAEALRTHGVPFVFATGYGSAGLESEWRDQPALQKPFEQSDLAAAIRLAMSGDRRSSA